jgi:hypothetical protein
VTGCPFFGPSERNGEEMLVAYFKVLSINLPRETEENREKHNQDSVPVETRTEHLQNPSQKLVL